MEQTTGYLVVNIKTDLKERVYEEVEWIHIGQDTDQWRTCENYYKHSGSIQGRGYLEKVIDY
jgi:hypothetical protein